MLPSYLNYFSEIMPFIFCIYFLKKNKSKDIKVFFVYTIFLFISIIAVIIFRYILRSHETYILFDRFFIIAEYTLISQFFAYNIQNLTLKKATQYSVIPFSLFSLLDYLTTINQSFSYYPLVAECLLFPIIIIIFFYEKMKFSTKYPIYASPAFWIAIAFLIFSTGNFFLFLFSKLLLLNADNKPLYNDIYGFFTILKNVLLCIAIVVVKNFKNNDEEFKININLELEAFPLPKL